MKNKLTIGAHMSISGGYAAMFRAAIAIDGNTMQYFTRNPRGGDAKALDPDDVAEAHKIAEEYGPLFGHDRARRIYGQSVFGKARGA